jgi:hypothetical protein
MNKEREMIRTFKCEVDFAHCITLGEFLEYLEKYDSPKIVEYIAIGPGGGNPCLILEFTDKATCEKFLIDHYQEAEVNEFIQNQIF